jgi:hypothetical protein
MISFCVPNVASKRKGESDKSGNTSKNMIEDEAEHSEDVDNVFSVSLASSSSIFVFVRQ